MAIEVLFIALLMVLLGVAYVKGYDAVKRRSPEHLPHFYLILATARMLIVLTVVGLYALFSDDRDATVRFALIIIIMYAIMMITTLSMRH